PRSVAQIQPKEKYAYTCDQKSCTHRRDGWCVLYLQQQDGSGAVILYGSMLYARGHLLRGCVWRSKPLSATTQLPRLVSRMYRGLQQLDGQPRNPAIPINRQAHKGLCEA